jgi:hypothetical protein
MATDRAGRCLLSKRSDTDKLLVGRKLDIAGHQSRKLRLWRKRTRMLKSVAGKPSNRPRRFIDFPDKNWLRSVNFRTHVELP